MAVGHPPEVSRAVQSLRVRFLALDLVELEDVEMRVPAIVLADFRPWVTSRARTCPEIAHFRENCPNLAISEERCSALPCCARVRPGYRPVGGVWST